MRECKKCRNLIPDGMRICPHCESLPNSVPKQFYLYAVLTVISAISAVYFRPFAGGAVMGEMSPGALIAGFVILVLFALIFLAVSVILLVAGKDADRSQKLKAAERRRIKNMQQHIRSQHHFYENGSDYCSVCGHRR